MFFTLFFYLSQKFYKALVITFLTVSVFVFLLETIEFARGYNTIATTYDIIEMSLLRHYEHTQQVLSLILFYSVYYFYNNMTKNHELIALKAIGYSIWQIIFPLIINSLIFGLICIFILNPIGAYTYSRYDQLLEKKYGRGKYRLSSAKHGIWLQEKHGQGDRMILHVLRVEEGQNYLFDAQLFMIKEKWNVDRYILADRILLKDNKMLIYDPIIINNHGESKYLKGIMTLPTKITFSKLQDSIAPPQLIPFIKLISFIEEAQNAGFAVLEHRVYFLKLLVLPLLFIPMMLIAIGLVVQKPRHLNDYFQTIKAIIVGIIIYFTNNFINLLGVKGIISHNLAIFLPFPILLMFGILLVHYNLYN